MRDAPWKGRVIGGQRRDGRDGGIERGARMQQEVFSGPRVSIAECRSRCLNGTNARSRQSG